MYVGFILKNEKERRPEIGKGLRSFSPRTRGMCFCSGYSSRVAPLRCPLRLPEQVIKHVLFRFRVQKYNNYLTYANFFQKKMQKYVVKHKKTTPKGRLSLAAMQ